MYPYNQNRVPDNIVAVPGVFKHPAENSAIGSSNARCLPAMACIYFYYRLIFCDFSGKKVENPGIYAIVIANSKRANQIFKLRSGYITEEGL